MMNNLNLYLITCGMMVLLTASACGDSGNDGVPGFDSDDSDLMSTDSGYQSSDSDNVYIEPTASCDNVVTGGTLWLTDETNYTFSSSVSAPDIIVKSATDLTFDWGGLTKDMFGETINPTTEINTALVTLWGMTKEELAEKIRTDNLLLSDNKGALVTFPPSNAPYTSQNLFNFTSPDGSEMTYEKLMSFFDTTAAGYSYPQDTHTFMLIGATGTSLGKNSRMISFFHLDPAATETTVSLTDTSTKFDFTTNLAQIMPVPVPTGNGALVANWEYINTNALNNKFVASQITEVMVAHYSNITRPQLDAQFLNLKKLADNRWTGEVPYGYSMDLSTLLNDQTGAAFTGVDSNGIWILALFCTKTCNNPAPWSITILQAC